MSEPAALTTGKTDGLGVAIERLIDMLHKQRQAMLRSDAGAAMEIETATREIEQALATFAALTAPPALRAGTRHASASQHLEPATVARLREALQSGQQAQAMFAAGNRRALHALFGAPDLYSR